MNGNSTDYAVCVSFEVRPDHLEDFLARVRKQAEDSLTEPGCKVFDVWAGGANSAEVFLYEIYEDRAAFDSHLATPHFVSFDAAVADMVVAKRVSTWEEKQ